MVRTRFAVSVLGAVLLLTACGSGDQPESGEVESFEEVEQSDTEVGAEESVDPPPAGKLTTSDVGTGVITVDGIAYDGISGSCDLSKNFGMDPLVDPNEDGVTLVLGVDNVSSGTATSDNEFNFTVVAAPAFRMAGTPSGQGTLDLLVIEEPRTQLEHVDLGVLSMNGVTDDGTLVTASIVCIIDKP